MIFGLAQKTFLKACTNLKYLTTPPKIFELLEQDFRCFNTTPLDILKEMVNDEIYWCKHATKQGSPRDGIIYCDTDICSCDGECFECNPCTMMKSENQLEYLARFEEFRWHFLKYCGVEYKDSVEWTGNMIDGFLDLK